MSICVGDRLVCTCTLDGHMSSLRCTVVCKVHWSQDSVVGLDGPGLETRRGQDFFLSFKTSRPALSLTQPPG
jgi:hypothetical protein